MFQRLLNAVRLGLVVVLCSTGLALAAPYAALVMDARTGEILHSRNADTRLHPASLTKMMTLYLAFDAIRRGKISLDTKVKISRKAAAEEPSKLGLKPGQRIALRYLIRGAAVKSANDAATAIGEALAGSEAAFARRMNRMAKALGMTNTTFKNAHGLTESGHQSTARDMTVLGRHLLYDYPEYYNLFSRKTADAGVRRVAHTNRRLLNSYKGADGIKTGYTRAAGFTIVASAERDRERIIATVFGGRSTASRNARVAELLDMGFKRAPSTATLRKPTRPIIALAAKTKRETQVAAVRRSLRPRPRPDTAPAEDLIAALVEDVTTNVTKSRALTRQSDGAGLKFLANPAKPLAAPTPRPKRLAGGITPLATPDRRQIITRASTSGNGHWGISLGKYYSRDAAERLLLQTALQEIETLDDALRKVVQRPQGWEANFVGMSRNRAELACARLDARGLDCEMRGPAG